MVNVIISVIIGTRPIQQVVEPIVGLM